MELFFINILMHFDILSELNEGITSLIMYGIDNLVKQMTYIDVINANCLIIYDNYSLIVIITAGPYYCMKYFTA